MYYNVIKNNKIILICLISLTIVGCSSKNTNKYHHGWFKKSTKKFRYKQKYDGHPYPKDIPDLSKVKEPVPKKEPKSKYGNPSKYTVFNKTYKVLKSSGGFKERGYASWYGTKFHGFKTSNGEVYDMYNMTAAHKTLPLPTYIKVTNLYNKRSVIVKVNDRGPFYSNRIIDLSYAAANKLDIIGKGVGFVEIVAINNKVAPKFKIQPIQIGSFTNKNQAKQIYHQLESILKKYKSKYKDNDNYRINIIEDRLKNTSKKNTLYRITIDVVNKEKDIKNLKAFLSSVKNQQIRMLAQSIKINNG